MLAKASWDFYYIKIWCFWTQLHNANSKHHSRRDRLSISEEMVVYDTRNILLSDLAALSPSPSENKLNVKSDNIFLNSVTPWSLPSVQKRPEGSKTSPL